MYVLAGVAATFAAAAAIACVPRRFTRAATLASATIPAATFAYFLSLIREIRNGQVVDERISWVPSLGLDIAIYVDGLALLMALLITGIGTLVVIYAAGYLRGHERIRFFFASLFAFMGSMLGLVVAGNLLLLFIFWELTSITSFLLIGFEGEKPSARKAATQALLVTGGGGLALLGGLVLVGMEAGTLDVATLLREPEVLRESGRYPAILALVLAGCFAKSAQFPLHFWLPAAMAAPTPVSAYLHSATMVKAGVFLLARLHPVLGGTDAWAWALGVGGALTAVVGGISAVRQSDLKLILAYSTVASLGLLVALLGLGTTDAALAAMAFLLAHALYKACLFLCAGSIDHELHSRDVHVLRGIGRTMPFTAAALFVGCLGLMGLPPLFAFVAKEAMLEAMLHPAGGPPAPALLAATVLASALFTLAAMNVLRTVPGPAGHGGRHEAPPEMLAGPVTLAAALLVVGVAPGLAKSGVIQAAVPAVAGVPVDVSLKLWHGFNVPLALSAASVALGLAAFALQVRIPRVSTPALEWAVRAAPGRVYDDAYDGLTAFARAFVKTVQSGILRRYVTITVLSALALVAIPLVPAIDRALFDTGVRPAFYEYAVAAVIAGGAIVAIVASSRLAGVVGLGVVGFGVATIFALFGAPDLAMTQFLVETLTVLIFVLVFYRLPRLVDRSRRWVRLRDAAVALAFGATMSVLVLMSMERQSPGSVSRYFNEAAVPEAFGRNVVNVILVDFRALDTLGEITVLAAAAIGIVALLRLGRRLR